MATIVQGGPLSGSFNAVSTEAVSGAAGLRQGQRGPWGLDEEGVGVLTGLGTWHLVLGIGLVAR